MPDNNNNNTNNSGWTVVMDPTLNQEEATEAKKDPQSATQGGALNPIQDVGTSSTTEGVNGNAFFNAVLNIGNKKLNTSALFNEPNTPIENTFLDAMSQKGIRVTPNGTVGQAAEQYTREILRDQKKAVDEKISEKIGFLQNVYNWTTWTASTINTQAIIGIPAAIWSGFQGDWRMPFENTQAFKVALSYIPFGSVGDPMAMMRMGQYTDSDIMKIMNERRKQIREDTPVNDDASGFAPAGKMLIPYWFNSAMRKLDNASFNGGDQEDFGNALTRWMQRRTAKYAELFGKEAPENIFQDENGDAIAPLEAFGNLTAQDKGAYMFNMTSNLVGSAVGFAAGGGATAKLTSASGKLTTRGISHLSKGKYAPVLGEGSMAQAANALLLTETESVQVAAGLYDTIYDDIFIDGANEIMGYGDEEENVYRQKEQQVYEDAKNAFLAKHPGQPANAIKVGRKIQRQWRENWIIENGERAEKLRDQAQITAVRGSNTVMQVNSLNFVLNMTAAGRFLPAKRALTSPKYIKNKPSLWRLAPGTRSEMIQEYAEETINTISEAAGTAKAYGETYQISDALQTAVSWKGVESGVWGALGGGGQTMLTGQFTARFHKDHDFKKKVEKLKEFYAALGEERPDSYYDALESKSAFKQKQELYEAQQKLVKQYKKMIDASGTPELYNLTAMKATATEMWDLFDQLNKEGITDKDREGIIQKLLFTQARSAFETGTTKQLKAVYKHISKADNVSKEDKASAIEALKEINKMEDIWVESRSYRNADALFEKSYRLETFKDKLAAEEAKLEEYKAEVNEDLSNMQEAFPELFEVSVPNAQIGEDTESSPIQITADNLLNPESQPGSGVEQVVNENGQIELFDKKTGLQIQHSEILSRLSSKKGPLSVKKLIHQSEVVKQGRENKRAFEEELQKATSEKTQKQLAKQDQMARQIRLITPDPENWDKYLEDVYAVMDKYEGKIDSKVMIQIREKLKEGVEKKIAIKQEIEKDNFKKKEEGNKVKTPETPPETEIVVDPSKTEETEEVTEEYEDDLDKVFSKAEDEEAKKTFAGVGVSVDTNPKIEGVSTVNSERALELDSIQMVTTPTGDSYVSNNFKGATLKDIEDQINSKYDKKEAAEAAEQKILDALPSQENDEIFDREVNDKTTPEQDEAIRKVIRSYYDKIAVFLDGEPTFEQFMEIVTDRWGVETARGKFKGIVRGWRLNNYEQIDETEEYDKLFGTWEQLDAQFAEVLQIEKNPEIASEEETQMTPVTTKKDSEEGPKEGKLKDTINKGKKEDHSKLNKELIREDKVSDEENPKIGYSIRKFTNEVSVEVTEDGTEITIIGKTEGTESSNAASDYEFLMRRGAFQKGTALRIFIPSNYLDLGNPVKNDRGFTVKDSKTGRPQYQSFRAFLQENKIDPTLPLAELVKIPGVIERIPMKIEGPNGIVTEHHNIQWYNDKSKFVDNKDGNKERAIQRNLAIRNMVAQSSNFNIGATVTQKKPGHWNNERTNMGTIVPKISVSEANPQAILGFPSEGVMMVNGKKFEREAKDGVQGRVIVREKINGASKPFPPGNFGYSLTRGEDDPVTGNQRWYALYTSNNNYELSTVARTNITWALMAYFGAYEAGSAEEKLAKEFAKSVLTNLGIDITKSGRTGEDGLKTYLNMFIFSPKNQYTGNYWAGFDKSGSSFEFGSKGLKEGFNVVENIVLSKNDSPKETQRKLAILRSSVLPLFPQNANKFRTGKPGNMTTVDEQAGTVVQVIKKNGEAASSYDDYLTDNLYTNIKAFNVGTQEKPEFVLEVQPTIIFEPDNKEAYNKEIEKQGAAPKTDIKGIAKEAAKETVEKVTATTEAEAISDEPINLIDNINNNLEGDLSLNFIGTGTRKREGVNEKTIETEIKEGNKTLGIISFIVRDGKLHVGFVEVNKQGKGTASKLYKDINNSLQKLGYDTLRSDETFLDAEGQEPVYIYEGKEYSLSEIDKMFTTDELVNNLENGTLTTKDKIKPGENLWKSLERKGLAEKTKSGYKFKSQPTQQTKETTTNEDVETATTTEAELAALMAEGEQLSNNHKEYGGYEAQIEKDEVEDPEEMTPEARKEMADAIARIPGITAIQQDILSNYIYYSIISTDFNSSVSKKELLDKIRKSLDETINPVKEQAASVIERLQTIIDNNPTKFSEQRPKILEIIEGNQQLLNSIQAIEDNYELLEKAALEQLEKYVPGLKIVKNEKKDDNVDQIGDWSKESIEESGKETASYRMKRFLSGIKHLKKTNEGFEPVLGWLNIPVIMDMDETYNLIEQILADTPSSFVIMMEMLKLNLPNFPQLKGVIEKLESADPQIQKEFVSDMSKHNMSMQYVAYSYDYNTKKYTLKVYDTNSSELSKNLTAEWVEDFRNKSRLVTNAGGDYYIDQDAARIAQDEYDSWRDDIKSLPNNLYPITKNIPLPKKGERKNISNWIKRATNLKNLVDQTHKEHNGKIKHSFSKDGRAVVIEKDGDQYFIRDIKRPQDTDKTVLKNWLKKWWGIEISLSTLTAIEEEGLRHNGKDYFLDDMFTLGDKPGIFALLSKQLNTYIDRDSKKISLEEKDSNPIKSNSIINTALAKLDSKFGSSIAYTRSWRDGGKTIFGLTAPKYVTDRINDLKSKDGTKRKELLRTSYSGNSMTLELLDNSEAFRDKFNIVHLGLTAIKEYGKKAFQDADVQTLADFDHELTKLGFFMDTTQGTITFEKDGVKVKMRMAGMFSPTMSDKKIMTVIKTAILNINTSNIEVNGEEYFIREELMDTIVEQTVVPELTRIANYIKLKGDVGSDVEGYVPQMIYGLPLLNSIIVGENKDGVGGGSLINAMTSAPETYTVEYILNPENGIIQKIEEETQKYISKLVNKKVKLWNTAFVKRESDKNGKVVETIQHLDQTYLEGTGGKGVQQQLKLAAYDYVINSLIATSNSWQIISGDPAQYYSKKGATNEFDYIKIAESTFDNYGKRLAAQIAPGKRISGEGTYLQLFLDDDIANAANLEYLEKIHGVNAFKYLNIEGTDAQEYTTWKEHLLILEELGRLSSTLYGITEEDLNRARELAEEGRAYDELDKKDQLLLKHVFQPLKPVYSGQKHDSSRDMMRMVYIKSSSFPLVPNFTKTLEIDKLRVVMEDIENDDNYTEQTVRAVYHSGAKVGAPKERIKLFDEDGRVIDKNLKPASIKKSSLILNRNDLRIQQEIPYKSGKTWRDVLSMGTQTTKLLFGDGIIDLLNGQDTRKDKNGKPLKSAGTELHSKFADLFKQLLSINEAELYDELGIDPKTKTPFDQKKTNEKLERLLIKEAKDRDYPKQTIEALALNKDGEFVLPVWASPDAYKFEALLNAIVTSRVLKLKFPGYAYVAGAQAGFKSQKVTEIQDLSSDQASQIVWTKSEYAENGISGTLGKGKDGKLIKAQVILPSKFRTPDGQILDLFSGMNKEKTEGTYIKFDEEKKIWLLKKDMIDERLLSLTTFRIPTSGHMSMSEVEIAGFIPQSMGDLMIVPTSFTVQMGLDFDVDKQQAYALNHKILADGKIVREDSDYSLEDINESITEIETLIEEEEFKKEKLHAEISKLQTEIQDAWEKSEIKLSRKIEINKALIKEVPKTKEELKTLLEDLRTLKDLRKKTIENQIIDIHHKVLSNPSDDVQRKITRVLSMDYATEQAALIQKEERKRDDGDDGTYFTALSDEYQKKKLMAGASGKVGIGAYSLDVVFQSLANQQRALGNTLILQDTITKNGEDILVPLKLRFGKGTPISMGDLGRLKTLDGNRDISEVLAELQNLATDNEKAQVMGKVNMTKETFNIHKVLVLLGFDKGSDGNSIPFLFLSQPIIKDYVKEVQNAKASISGYDPDAETKIIEKLQKKYGTEAFDLLLNADKSKAMETGADAMSTENMLNSVSKPDGFLQGAVLNRFLALKKHGLNIASLQSNLNLDSKGLGKSFFDVIERMENLESMASMSEIKNSTSLFGEFAEKNPDAKSATLSDKETVKSIEELKEEGWVELENYMVKPTTVEGNFAARGISQAYFLWKDQFPYQSESFKLVYNEISEIIKISLSSVKRVERKQMIFREMRKYLNSSYKNNFYANSSSSPQQERQRLFMNQIIHGDTFVTKKDSLSSYLNDLKDLPQFKELFYNPLLRRLTFTVNQDGRPSLIKFNNSAGDNFDESSLYNALTYLIDRNQELPPFKDGTSENGRPYTTALLAQDLIAYSMLEGGIQEVVQFVKFTPIKYLEIRNYANRMRTINFNRNSTFGINGLRRPNSSTSHMYSEFTMQFIQNNPSLALPITPEQIRTEYKIEEETTRANGKKIIESFSIRKANLDTKEKDGAKEPFLRIYDKYAKKGQSKFILYKFDGVKYKRIPTLGVHGMAEYAEGKKDYNSLVNAQVVVPVIVNTPSIQPAPVDLLPTKFGLNESNLFTTINQIAADESLGFLSKLAAVTLPYLDPNTKIVINSEMTARGKFGMSTNTIHIRKSWANDASPEEVALTIMKEYIHSITALELRKYIDLKTGVVAENAPPHIKRIVRLFKAAEQAMLSATDKDGKPLYTQADIDRVRAAKGELQQGDKEVLYGVRDVFEFVEMMMTQPEFQKFMGDKPYAETGKTISQKFKEFIRKLFTQALGLDFNKDTITAESFDSIFEIVQKNVETQGYVNPLTTLLKATTPADIDKVLAEADEFIAESERYFTNLGYDVSVAPTPSGPTVNFQGDKFIINEGGQVIRAADGVRATEPSVVRIVNLLADKIPHDMVSLGTKDFYQTLDGRVYDELGNEVTNTEIITNVNKKTQPGIMRPVEYGSSPKAGSVVGYTRKGSPGTYLVWKLNSTGGVQLVNSSGKVQGAPKATSVELKSDYPVVSNTVAGKTDEYIVTAGPNNTYKIFSTSNGKEVFTKDNKDTARRIAILTKALGSRGWSENAIRRYLTKEGLITQPIPTKRKSSESTDPFTVVFEALYGIYNKIGNETAPEGRKVVIPKDKSKAKTPQPGAVVAFRTKGKTEQNMIEALDDNAVGNPFGPYAAIKENSTGVAVDRFLGWLTGETETTVMQDYRQALLNKIPELRDKTIYYYKDLGRPSHATVLDWLVNSPESPLQSSQETESTRKVTINNKKWTKDSPKENPNTAYVFTENINSIGDTRVGGGSAVIRNNPNAVGIVTKKYYTYKENRNANNKEQWDANFQDTDADFELFKKVNLEQFAKLDKFDSKIFPDSFANSLAAVPNRFALWLQNELQTRYGLVTEVNSKGTGLISKSVQPTKSTNVEKTGLQERMTEKLPQIASPNAKKHVPKELVKTKIATQYIGDGSTNSSTDRYRVMYEEEGVANTGEYTSEDVVYVSSNGNRPGRVNPVKNGVLQGEYLNVQKAMDAGATIVMDTAAHLQKTGRYNIGELALAEYLQSNGYRREGQSGIWKPAQQAPSITETELKAKKADIVKRWQKAITPMSVEEIANQIPDLNNKPFSEILSMVDGLIKGAVGKNVQLGILGNKAKSGFYTFDNVLSAVTLKLSEANVDSVIQRLKENFDSTKDISKNTLDKINAKYDAEYVDAVKKGTITKEQAIQAPSTTETFADNSTGQAIQTQEQLQESLNPIGENRVSTRVSTEGIKGNIHDMRSDKSSFVYTDEQFQVLSMVQEFLDTPITETSDLFFLVAGYAGTGKTTIAENMAKYSDAQIIAPTNTAVNNLKSKFGALLGKNSDRRFSTIHSLIYGEPNDEGEWVLTAFPQNTVLIIDEASLIDTDVLLDLFEEAKKANTKLILMGDSFQLEPVGKNPSLFDWAQGESKIKSFVKGDNQFTMTKVMRASGAILGVATSLRNNSDQAPEILDYKTDEVTIVRDLTTTKEFKEDISNGENRYIIITATNPRRNFYNGFVRGIIHKGKEDPVTDTQVRKSLMSGGPPIRSSNLLAAAYENEKMMAVSTGDTFANGEQYLMQNLKLEEVIKDVVVTLTNGKKQTIEVHLYKHDAVHPVTKELLKKDTYTYVIPKLDGPSLPGNTLAGMPEFETASILKEGKIRWNPKYHIATYGYAMTAHKSQGHEFDNVHIDYNYKREGTTDKQSAKWVYTAVTRAKKKVRIKETGLLTLLELNEDTDPFNFDPQKCKI